MESLSDKKDRSDKERAADRAQVAEWLASNKLVNVAHGGAWYRGGELIKAAKTVEEARTDWTDSPFGWR
jgi:hypothetical protein